MTTPNRHVGWPWSMGLMDLDDSAVVEFVPLATSDRVTTFGVRYQPSATVPRTCFLVVHPRLDFSRFYAAPGLLAAGYGLFCVNTRFLNNDSDAQHERMLLDIAAAMRHLRDAGVQDVVLIGNSGGGSLVSFYQSQAALDPSARISRTPGGDRINLADEDMPVASGQVHVAVHVGEGDFMAEILDPAVVDESQPTLSDPELDLYDERNGRRPYPEPSSFDPAWVARYRLAQAERCARLDRIALAMIGDRRALRSQLTPETLAGSPALRRARLTTHYMTVYRTLANPFYLDPTIDPSARGLGSCVVHGQDPIIGNYALFGFARLVTARAWLSNWSPTFTQTSMIKNVATYDIPSLFVEATGDTESGPEQFRQIVDASIAKDITTEAIAGDHYMRRLEPDAPDPKKAFNDAICAWASSRFDP